MSKQTYKVTRNKLWQCWLGTLCLLVVSAVAQRPAYAQADSVALPTPGQTNPNGMHIFLWGGLKSHGPGQHDYPQYMADWSKLLTEKGAFVDGGFHVPTAAELEHTDVVILYKGDAGYLTAAQKSVLEAYVKRGGGLVTWHDSMCGPDPQYFATTFTGGAKKHGETNFTLEADVPYTVVDKENPIMKDFPDMTIQDEAFFLMTWAKDPGIHVLANVVIAGTPSAGTHKGEIVPQMWTYEHTLPGGQPARAYVWMQGHNYSNFSNPQIQKTLLRGIAWAAKRPVDELNNYVQPAGRGGGGRGGSGRGGGRGGSGGGGRGPAAQ